MVNKQFSLSIKDTNILKGVALLLLLAHHLFYIQEGLYDDIQIVGNHFLVQDIGGWSKLCVAIFVFLSGYGLTVGAMRTQGIMDIKRFYWHRFTKLLMNYWFIWLLFVPLSVFVFGRTFTDAYQTLILPKFILDFFGIINCFGWYGYNATWWFYSCIIVLYFAFPWLYKLMESNLCLFVSLVIALHLLPSPLFKGTIIYLACFVTGMVLCRYKDKIQITPPILSFSLFVIFSVERFVAKDVMFFDSVLTLSLIMAYKNIKLPNIIRKMLEFIGKQSMNIFLFHTFIYCYWFKDFIYESRNPIIIYMLLLSICLLISILIETIKKIIHFDRLVILIESSYGVRQ